MRKMINSSVKIRECIRAAVTNVRQSDLSFQKDHYTLQTPKDHFLCCWRLMCVFIVLVKLR